MGYKIHKKVRSNKKDWSITINAHEPIIDAYTWNIVSSRINKHERPNKSGEVHIFSKKVYCECCDKIFMRNVFKTSIGNKAYLQCKGAKKYNLCTNSASIKIEDLEDLIINEINKLLKLYWDNKFMEDNIKKLIVNNNQHIKNIESLEIEKKYLEGKINDNKAYLKKIYEDRFNNLITDEIFINLMTDYSRENSDFLERKENVEKEMETLKSTNDNKNNIKLILKKYEKVTKLNKIIIDEFIDKIIIGKKIKEENTRKIEIIWNFSTNE